MVRLPDHKLTPPISNPNPPRSAAAPATGQPECVQKPETADQLYALAESILGFHLHPGQRQILDPALRRGLLNCSRQWGKSTVAALKAAFHAWTHAGHTVLIGSPSARQSEELLFKAHGFLRKLEPRASKSQSRITLPNRSRILALPNAPDNVRGYSADLVILDEAARIADELYTALLPSISARPDAPLLLLSTPAGRRGYFYKAWHNRLARVRLPCSGPRCSTPLSIPPFPRSISTSGPSAISITTWASTSASAAITPPS